MLNDLRYGLRALRRSPGFALTTIVLIALAIGATSAIFSLADAILLRPLPVADASNIVSIRSVTPSGNFGNVSYADYLDFRDKSRSFDDMIAYVPLPAAFSRDAATQSQLKVVSLVSGNFFRALGVEPQLGRGFRTAEDQPAGTDAVVVLA